MLRHEAHQGALVFHAVVLGCQLLDRVVLQALAQEDLMLLVLQGQFIQQLLVMDEL